MSRDLTDVILTAVATGTGKNIGDATAPTDTTLPYAVLYPLPSVVHDGDLGNKDREREWVYQFTSVGATRGQTQWMADKIQTSIEDDTFAPTDVTLMGIETDSRGSVQRDDDATRVSTGDTVAALFYSVDTYRFMTTR